MTKFDESAEATKASAGHASPALAEANTCKRRRLWLLLAAHAILGAFFCIWSAVEGAIPSILIFLPHVLVVALIPAQMSLLGFWAVLSSASWWVRLAGLITGIIYLEFLFGTGTHSEPITWLGVLTTGGIAAVFGVIRWRYADLRRFPQHAPSNRQERPKLSIRGLMLFTFFVAVTIVGLKVLRGSGPHLFGLPVWGLCFVVVGLASAWAGLGLARPMLRIVVVLLIAGVLGFLFEYAQNAGPWMGYFYTISTMLLQAGVLIASLLVVRSCGYRLVRKSATDVEPLD